MKIEKPSRLFGRGKAVRLLALIVSTLLIGSATAAVFFSLTFRNQASITAADVRFVSGADAGTDGTTVTIGGTGNNATYARISGMKAHSNITKVYEKLLNVSNTGGSAHNIRLSHVSITPATGNTQVSNWTQIDFKLVHSNGTALRTLTYTTTGDTWNIPADTSYVSIAAGVQYAIRIEIKAAANATSALNLTIDLDLDVQV